MYIKINQYNEIVDNSKNYIELSSNDNKLIIYGNFISLFRNKKFFTKKESLEIFKISLDNTNHL